MLTGGPRFQAEGLPATRHSFTPEITMTCVVRLNSRKVDSDFLQGAAFGVGTEKSFYYGGTNQQYSGKEYPPTSGHVFLKSPWVGNDPTVTSHGLKGS
jgi:hypothetical protein